MKQILIVTAVPYWRRQRGNEVRIHSLVHYLRHQFRIHVAYLGVHRLPPDTDCLHHTRLAPASGLTRAGLEVFERLPERWRAHVVGWLNRRRYTRTPDDFRSEATLTALRRLYTRIRPDVVLVEYIWYAYTLEAVDRQTSTCIIDTLDVMHLRARSYAGFGRVPDRSCGEAEEIAVLSAFDAVLAQQRADADYLRGRICKPVLLVPHAEVPRRGFYAPRLARRDDRVPIHLAYVGSASEQNADAVEWFLAQVWDETMVTQFRLHLWGTICHLLDDLLPGVEAHGFVADVADAYAHADVAINPTRFGSGLKIKNVEALAFGVPVVTTSVGAEGLDTGRAWGLLVADSPADFRDRLRELADPGTRAAMSRGALAAIDASFAATSCYEPLVRFIENRCSD